MAEPRDSGERDEWRVEVTLDADEEGIRWASGCASSTSTTRPASGWAGR